MKAFVFVVAISSLILGSSDPADNCRPNQIHVVGEFCPDVEQKCLSWLDSDISSTANGGMGPLRCQRFERVTRCLSSRRIHKDYCIDVFEWPNIRAALPSVGMTYWEALRSCESINKRLCTVSEATLACEGPDMKPYPYGYERDSSACNIDKPSADPETPRSRWPDVYRAVGSGTMTRCVSDYGVYDITGNVDEIVHNPSMKPHRSAYHGGYWGPVRTRCRPKTWIHDESFSFYQLGFRCCSDSR